MLLPLSEASKLVGVSRGALFKAIQRGKLSAVRDDLSGQWRVDVAELSRVYKVLSQDVPPPDSPVDSPAVLAERVRSLEKMVASLEDQRDDLRRRLDQEAAERREAQNKLTALLEHQPLPKEAHRGGRWAVILLAVLLLLLAAVVYFRIVEVWQVTPAAPVEKPAAKTPTPPSPGEIWKPDSSGG